MNQYQKISVIFLVLIIVVFFGFLVPFKNYHEITYGNIFSKSLTIDYLRLSIEMIVLGIVYYAVFRFLEGMTNLDINNKADKNIIKNEINIFLLFLLGSFFAIILMGLKNIIHNRQVKILTSQNLIMSQERDSLLITVNKKKDSRANFWYYLNQQYNLSEFDGKVYKLWSVIGTGINDDEYLKDKLSHFNQYTKDGLGIYTIADFREFYFDNSFNGIDIQNETLAVEKNKIISDNTTSINEIKWYYAKDFSKWFLISFFASFILLYPIRLFAGRLLILIKKVYS